MTKETTPRMRHAPEGGVRSWAHAWLSDSSQLLVSQALTVLATSVAAIMIARTLDPDDWGIFCAFLGLSMALALVADFGLGTWLLRELSRLLMAEDESDRSPQVGRLLSAAMVVNSVIALPLIVGALVWSLAARPGAGVGLALIALLVYGAMTAGANALEAHMRARRHVRLVLAASLLEKGVLVTLLVMVTLTSAGVGAIGLAYVVAGLTRIAFDGIVIFVRRGVPFVRPSIRAVRDLTYASFPFALTTASLNLVPRLDALVLLAMSATSAAWFAIGDRVLGPAFLLPATLGATLYPFMATNAARQVAPWRLAGALGALGAVLAAVGILLAPILIPTLFGEDYEDAVPVVQIMLVVIPIVYATSPLLVIAYSHGRERSLLIPALGLSLAGTVAIIAGQAVGGASLAAVGYVVRSVLFLAVVGTVALVAWHREMSTPRTDELSSHSQVSAQVQ